MRRLVLHLCCIAASAVPRIPSILASPPALSLFQMRQDLAVHIGGVPAELLLPPARAQRTLLLRSVRLPARQLQQRLPKAIGALPVGGGRELLEQQESKTDVNRKIKGEQKG